MIIAPGRKLTIGPKTFKAGDIIPPDVLESQFGIIDEPSKPQTRPTFNSAKPKKENE